MIIATKTKTTTKMSRMKTIVIEGQEEENNEEEQEDEDLVNETKEVRENLLAYDEVIISANIRGAKHVICV